MMTGGANSIVERSTYRQDPRVDERPRNLLVRFILAMSLCGCATPSTVGRNDTAWVTYPVIVADWPGTAPRTLHLFPVNHARISSVYGMRYHPILKAMRLHRGVDFAAPAGTPVTAAGSGEIVALGPRGSYGNYVRIRHSETYETAYAHLDRYADGMRVGAQVNQGDVIGYVGSTGRVTGPHLHFEVLVGGKQVDPRILARTREVQIEDQQVDQPLFAHAHFATSTQDDRLSSFERVSGWHQSTQGKVSRLIRAARQFAKDKYGQLRRAGWKFAKNTYNYKVKQLDQVWMAVHQGQIQPVSEGPEVCHGQRQGIKINEFKGATAGEPAMKVACLRDTDDHGPIDCIDCGDCSAW